MNKMSGETVDLTSKNIEKLKELFPEIISEGEKIDFDKLKIIMGNAVENQKERYNFTWHGKKESMLGAQKPSKGTLRPDKEKSKNFDTTENLYIEGDNLETLKLLQKSYNNKVKVIYIDPPYNTGNDFVYKDNFKEGIDNYLEQTGQVDSEGNQLSTNSESQGRYHSNWLNMMYPRLKLARNLLAKDGVILISIDENEFVNLKRICDEILGESNYRNSILVRRRVKSLNLQFADNGLNSFNVGYEYVLVYSKSTDMLMTPLRMKKKNYSKKGSWNVFWSNADRPTMRYDLLGFMPQTGQWRWVKEKAEKAVNNYKDYEENYSEEISLEEYWEKTGKKLRFIRKIPNGKGKNGGVQYWVSPNDTSLRTSNWLDLEVSQIHKEFNIPFDNPKNSNLIKELLKLIDEKDFLAMDFFSGSATTAHATMELNAEDGGNRKFIMVQLPEPLDEKSEAYKDGYRTICDIGKERIRRAGEKVKQDLIEKNNKEGLLEDNQVDPDSLDIGFRVFKLDKSNIKEWNVYFDQLDQLDLYEDIFVEGRSELDVVYEILLKNGIELTYPISTFDVDGKQVYDIAYGNLFICLADKIDTSVAKAIVDKRNEYAIETSSVVFKDAGFGGNDSEKLNVIEILKDAGYTDDQLLTI